MTIYYVDATLGDDEANGTTELTPWQTLAKVNGFAFSAGDIIKFKKGETWTGPGTESSYALLMDNDGTSGSRITVDAYSTGDAPLIKNTGAVAWSDIVSVTGDYVTIQNLKLEDCTEAGVSIAATASYTIVTDNEITDVGIGVYNKGTYTTVKDNNIHILHVVVSDEYGAIGVIAYNGPIYVYGNTFLDCICTLDNDDPDGCAVEFYVLDGNDVNDSLVYNNSIKGCYTALEVGAETSTNEAHDISFYYNIFESCNKRGGNFASIHNSGGNEADVSSLKIDNNVVVFYKSAVCARHYNCIYSDSALDPGVLYLRNNIFYLDWIDNFILNGGSNVTENHNCVYRVEGATCTLGVTLDGTDVTTDPLFTTTGGFPYTYHCTNNDNDLSEWDATVTDGGNLSVSASAAMGGSEYGLAFLIDDQVEMYARVNISPPTSGKLRLRFYFDPNTLDMADGDTFNLFVMPSTGPGSKFFYIYFNKNGDDYRLQFDPRDDDGWWGTDSEVITDGPHYIEVYVTKASSDVASDGTYEWWIDGVSKGAWTGRDNWDVFAGITMAYIATGNLDEGTSGTFYADQLAVNTTGTEIGAVDSELPPSGTYTLQSASPCINAGVDVGLALDYISNPVPMGSTPDIGAYEYYLSRPAPDGAMLTTGAKGAAPVGAFA